MIINLDTILPVLRIALQFTNKARAGLLPIYTSVKFSGTDVEAFNGECGIIQKTTQDWSELNCVIPCAVFLSLLEKIAASYQEVNLEIVANGEAKQLKITAGTFSATLNVLPVEQWPDNGIATTPVQQSVELDNSFLANIRAAKFCAATDLAQALLASVAVKGSKVYAVEAKRIYVGNLNSTFPETPIVVINSLAEVLCQCGAIPTKVDVLDGKLVFYTPTSIIFGARFADDTRYPDVDSKLQNLVDPSKRLGTAMFDSEKVVTILRRLLVLNQHTSTAIELVINDNKLTFSNVAPNNATEVLECGKTEGVDVKAICNGQLLLDAASQFARLEVYGNSVHFSNQNASHLVAQLTV